MVIKNKALFSVSIQECFTIGCVPLGPLNNAFKSETSWSGEKKKKTKTTVIFTQLNNDGGITHHLCVVLLLSLFQSLSDCLDR